MSNVAVILQIMFITLGMVGLGIVLNRVLGLRKEKIRDFKERALNLQERVRSAQAIGDVQMMVQLQRETVQLSKQIMLKQFVPLCLRCAIFIGIFTILSFIYGPYASGLIPFQIPLLSLWVSFVPRASILHPCARHAFSISYANRKITVDPGLY